MINRLTLPGASTSRQPRHCHDGIRDVNRHNGCEWYMHLRKSAKRYEQSIRTGQELGRQAPVRRPLEMLEQSSIILRCSFLNSGLLGIFKESFRLLLPVCVEQSKCFPHSAVSIAGSPFEQSCRSSARGCHALYRPRARRLLQKRKIHAYQKMEVETPWRD